MRDDIEELHARVLGAALEARGVAVSTVRGVRRPGEQAEQWIAFVACGCHWFYRFGILLRGDRPDLAAARHVNGEMVAVTANKHETKLRLHRAAVAVAPGALFAATDVGRARAWFEAGGRPVCVKPNRGLRGTDVATHIADGQALAVAFAHVAARHREVLVEHHLEGDVLRVNCIDGRAVAVRLDRPANVLGDGRSTVAALVAAKNAERRRRQATGHVDLVLDGEAVRHLARQALRPESVPAAGRRVVLRGTSNIPTGGDVVCDPPGLHPGHVAFAERAVRALPGLRLAALDIVTPDLARPGPCHVLEVNSSPGIALFHFPWEGEPIDVAGALADWLLDPEGAAGSRPGAGASPAHGVAQPAR